MVKYTQTVILLHAKGISGLSKKTNKPYMMLTVEFLNSENLNPCCSSDGTDFGLGVVQANVPYELFGKIVEAPAIYEIDYDFTVDYQMNMKPMPVDMRFISSLADMAKK